MRSALLLTALLWSAAVVADGAATPGLLPLESFTRSDEFGEVKISPDGQLLAMTLGKYGSSALAFLDRKTGKLVGGLRQPNGTVIENFDWVAPTRVIYQIAERIPGRVEPIGTGEIFAIDVDGKAQALVYGYRAGDERFGTRVKARESSYATAHVVSTLPSDSDHILVAEQPWRNVRDRWQYDPDARPTVTLLNVRNGRKRELGQAPLASAQLLVDSSEQVRFAVGWNSQGKLAVAWRPQAEAPWQEFALPGYHGESIEPLGFTSDNAAVHFLAVPEGKSHRALYRMTLASGAIEKLSVADDVEVVGAVMDLRNERVIGYETYTDRLARTWLEKDHPSARFYRALERAFPGQTLAITSATSDGALAVAFIQSDVNPGDFYVVDTQGLKADFVKASRAWIDPRTMRPREPISLKARDGLQLHGYLTRPAGTPPHPLVVLPHGGPHGVRDWWEFDWEAQLLASRGYAVLQVNYRGSAGYGTDFQTAGYREWGGRMQDDLTDATRWALEQKIAAPGRVCIYGASYGGYAALMGVAREPDLYRCAVGYAGVYDLELVRRTGDIPDSRIGRAYLDEALGDDAAQLRSRSPTRLAPSIQAPVFLIHGTADFRADFDQAQAMKTALERAGKRFEWLALSREGHGIYDEETRQEAYQRILAFLDQHLNH
jgi:dipeptidyl aminopeptidase/acylaminoacyl peptidase